MDFGLVCMSVCACALVGLRGIPVAGGGCNAVSDGSLARLAKQAGIAVIRAKGVFTCRYWS